MIQELYNNGLSYRDIEVRYINDASTKLEEDAIKQKIELQYKCLFAYDTKTDEFITGYVCNQIDVILYRYKVSIDNLHITKTTLYRDTDFYRHNAIKNKTSVLSHLRRRNPTVVIFEVFAERG